MDKEVREKLDWIISILPEPFKTEFVEEVIVDEDEYDIRTLNKVFTYYIDDCQNELPEDVMNKIREKYIFINLGSIMGDGANG